MSIAKHIRVARKEHLALTQLELAHKLGTEPVTVSRWERGATEPSARYVRQIARMADLPVSWFYSDEDVEAVA